MATIVESTKTGHRYVLLGAGYGMFESARPSIIFGDLLPSKTQGAESMLAVCDAEGNVGWLRSEEARVVSVDGESPGAALG